MKNIAFIYTEYQQNILFSICLQENIKIEILFLREGIPLHKNADIYIDKVVYYEDNPFSWRSVWKYYQEYEKTIAQHINNDNQYRIFVWSLVNPLSRYAINLTQCKSIDLIEDGSGSYAKWGYNNYNLGFKAFVASTFIFWFTNILSRSLIPLKHSNIHGWSLFDDCYPDLDIKKNTIDHRYFQKLIRGNLNDTNGDLDIDNDSIIFITSAYVEYGILSEEEFMKIMIDSLEKIKIHTKTELNKVYWKPHPRSIVEDEKTRLIKIQEATNINFEIVNTNLAIEAFATVNQEKKLQYFSLGSSSLYVIKALIPGKSTVCLVENEALKNKVMNQLQLIKLYRSINVQVI